ncbi:YveK family protein [Paenibacillus mendelii]|uniref:YveK family protein n=1 Tax=Paenibacillus mendelii TaxID=206163 RepID=A0ABV6JJ79_9BACL|nr:Wzz/FepE/Etk N-terminal domain-containing protein [Paenibacillus mendelii]
MELKHYFKIIQKKFWLVAIIVIAACAVTAIRSYYMTTPTYIANAKLVVNQTATGEAIVLPNASLIQSNIMMINSYKEIIRSAAIMNKVVEKYPDLNVTARELAAKISITSANNSQIMNLFYKDTSYEKAAKSVNAISRVFKKEVPVIMKVDNVMVLNEAIVDDNVGPLSTNPVSNLLISFIVSLIIALGIVFLLDYLDNTYRTEAELENDLGLPMLAVVTKFSKVDRSEPLNAKKQIVGEGNYATINQ